MLTDAEIRKAKPSDKPRKLTNSGGLYAFGLELGQRFALSDSWSLTPQAQLTCSRVDADSFVDPFGAVSR